MSVITKVLTEEQMEEFLGERHRSLSDLREEVFRELGRKRRDRFERRRARVRAEVLKGSISFKLAQQ